MHVSILSVKVYFGIPQGSSRVCDLPQPSTCEMSVEQLILIANFHAVLFSFHLADWLDNVFIPTNHSRLRECHGMLCEFLERMKIPFLKRGSGLYVWADFREVKKVLH